MEWCDLPPVLFGISLFGNAILLTGIYAIAFDYGELSRKYEDLKQAHKELNQEFKSYKVRCSTVLHEYLQRVESTNDPDFEVKGFSSDRSNP